MPPDVLAALYTADVEDFVSVRQGRAAQAKQDGEPELARAITAQRKPTIAAWIVNRHAHADPSAVEHLIELGTRLRAAHEQLDPTALRELSGERRRLVTDLSSAALAGAQRTDPPAGLRDEVTDTFDAAVADPQIAARLGRLVRGEKWSGFGVAVDAPPGAPELTVIRGGRDRATPQPAGKASAKPARGQAATGSAKAADTARPTARNQARDQARGKAREKATAAFTAAETALHDSEQAEHDAVRRVRELSSELERTQQELAGAKRDHDRSRQELRSARNRLREARTALSRAQRPD